MQARSLLPRSFEEVWGEDDPRTFPRFLLSDGNQAVWAFGAERTFRAPADTPLRSAIDGAVSLAAGDEAFGGARFSPTKTEDPAWSPFGGAFFFVPRAVERFRVDASSEPSPDVETRVALEEIDAGAYREALSGALHAIARGEAEKIVLARRFLARAIGDAWRWTAVPRWIERLLRAPGEGRTFLFAPCRDAVWLGRTPEQLVRIEDDTVSTEAVAGTRVQDAENAHNSFHSSPNAKEEHEHRLVVAHLEEAMRARGLRPEIGSRLVRRSGRLLHLVTPVRARERELDVAALVGALHPTPAMNGAPRARALEFLAKHEGFDRGWYAGLLGALGPGRADLTVSIRGALFDRSRATLFAGGGLVRGSHADAESRETMDKAHAIAASLGWAPS